MDRPEDVDPNPQTGKVYVMLTNNNKRKADAVDGPNPRAKNDFGHIIELTPPNGDHDALTYAWDLLVIAGDPAKPEVGARYHQATSANGRSEEHTSELQSLMRISYAFFCLKKKKEA